MMLLPIGLKLEEEHLLQETLLLQQPEILMEEEVLLEVDEMELKLKRNSLNL